MKQQWIPKAFENTSPSNEANATQELGDSRISTRSPIGITETKTLKKTSYINSSQKNGKIHISIQDANGSLSV